MLVLLCRFWTRHAFGWRSGCLYQNTLVRWLGISDGNMAEGSRTVTCLYAVRANHLVHAVKPQLIPFHWASDQCWNWMEILEYGGSIDQETRLFDKWKRVQCVLKKKRTITATSRLITSNYCTWANRSCSLPELPAARRARFIADFGVTMLTYLRSHAKWQTFMKLCCWRCEAR